MAQRIRSLKDSAAVDDVRALDEAVALMNDFLATKQGSDYVRNTVVIELGRALRKPEVKQASYELLVQALISTWGVFEVFMSSMLIAVVNSNPALATTICSSAEYKRHLGKPVVDVDAIQLHGFDLSRAMGTILFSERRFDGLSTIKDLVPLALPTQRVRVALSDRTLWLLNQRRHLFVHKRGKVDAEYLKNTGETMPLGARLVIQSHDVEECLLTVRDTIIAVASAAREAS
jgi:hypothetical protein